MDTNIVRYDYPQWNHVCDPVPCRGGYLQEKVSADKPQRETLLSAAHARPPSPKPLEGGDGALPLTLRPPASG